MGGPVGVVLGLYWGFIGIMENKMETMRIRGYIRGSIGIMEKRWNYKMAYIYIYIWVVLSVWSGVFQSLGTE